MAIPFLKTGDKIVNVIVTDRAIRFVELKETNPIIVNHYGEKELPEGLVQEGRIVDRETVEMILEECIEDWKIKKRKVNFIIPSNSIVIRQLTIPSDIKDDEIKSYLFLEIGTSIHLPFGDPLFDVVVLKEGDKEKEILLIAAPEEIVLSYQDLFEVLKLKPISADISPLALYRFFCAHDFTNEDDHEMTIRFDQDQIIVAIFHNKVPIFVRPIMLDKEILHNDTLDHEEEVLFQLEDYFKEIEKVMTFYQYSLNQGQSAVNQVFLSGEHTSILSIYQALVKRLGLPIRSDQKIDVLDTDGLKVPTRFHLAVGLALKGVI
jgi:type IV pilus assembly protein PilM